MSRLNNKGEIFGKITEVGVFRDTPSGGSTTTTSTPAVGSKATLTLASATNFAIADWYRHGSLLGKAMINRIGNLVTTTLTPLYTHRFLGVSGDAVVEQTKVPLAHIDGAVRLAISGSQNGIQAEERDLPLGYLEGPRKVELSFAVLPFNLNNLLFSMGMRDADSAENIAGSGTTAAPHRTFVTGGAFRELNLLAFYVRGTAKSGRTLEAILTGCEINPAALQLQVQRGSKTPIPLRLVPTTGVLFTEID